MKRYGVLLCFILTPCAFAQQPEQTVAIGPWVIATTFNAGKFDSCSMSQTTVVNLGISFVRGKDGLLLLLDSPQVETRTRQSLHRSSDSRRTIRRSQSTSRD